MGVARLERAVTLLARDPRGIPTRQRCLTALGKCHEELGRQDSAVDAYERALEAARQQHAATGADADAALVRKAMLACADALRKAGAEDKAADVFYDCASQGQRLPGANVLDARYGLVKRRSPIGRMRLWRLLAFETEQFHDASIRPWTAPAAVTRPAAPRSSAERATATAGGAGAAERMWSGLGEVSPPRGHPRVE